MTPRSAPRNTVPGTRVAKCGLRGVELVIEESVDPGRGAGVDSAFADAELGAADVSITGDPPVSGALMVSVLLGGADCTGAESNGDESANAGCASGSMASATISPRPSATSRHVFALSRRVNSVCAPSVTVTRPLACGPTRTSTTKVRAASPGPTKRADAVRARTLATNSASVGHPASARYSSRIGSDRSSASAIGARVMARLHARTAMAMRARRPMATSLSGVNRVRRPPSTVDGPQLLSAKAVKQLQSYERFSSDEMFFTNTPSESRGWQCP